MKPLTNPEVILDGKRPGPERLRRAGKRLGQLLMLRPRDEFDEVYDVDVRNAKHKVRTRVLRLTDRYEKEGTLVNGVTLRSKGSGLQYYVIAEGRKDEDLHNVYWSITPTSRRGVSTRIGIVQETDNSLDTTINAYRLGLTSKQPANLNKSETLELCLTTQEILDDLWYEVSLGTVEVAEPAPVSVIA
jgi:hypothetical protein